MVQHHSPVVVDKLIDICSYYRRVLFTTVGHAQVLMDQMHCQLDVFCSLYSGESQCDFNIACEDLFPTGGDCITSLNKFCHRVYAFDTFAVGPDVHHCPQVSVFKGIVEGAFGVFRGRETGFGHIQRSG